MADSAEISSIPEELIVHIFQFCDTKSLGRLSRTCKKFKRIVDTEDACWRSKSKYALGSNMYAPAMKRRSKPILSMKERCRISRKWLHGAERKSIVVKFSKCMPWVSLDQNYFFCSKEGVLVQYKRRYNGNVLLNRNTSAFPHTDDVSRFVINGSEVVSAGRDGTLSRFTRVGLRRLHTFEAHSHEINSVDALNNIIVTGSKDSFIKIWDASTRKTVCQKEIAMGIRVLSVAMMPSSSHFIVGLPGTDENHHPLQLFDLERGEHITNFGGTYRRGAGILCIYPESAGLFLSCGYDTTVKLWDERAPQAPVAYWMDPYDNGIYCVTSDHNITVITGACRNGIVHIWDKRSTFLKDIYFAGEYNSPVYSIDFDACHLYAAFDRAILQYSYM